MRVMKRLEKIEDTKSGAEKSDFAHRHFLDVAEFLGPLSVTPHTSSDLEPRVSAIVAPPEVVSRTGSDTYVLMGVASDLGQQFALSGASEFRGRAAPPRGWS